MKTLNIRNFRDIHGYQNCYGEYIKANKIFRGATLDALSLQEAIYMEEILGIRYILDFRDEQESLKAPDITFPHAQNERIGALKLSNTTNSGFDFGSILKEEITPEKLQFLISYIRQGYETMAFNNAAYHRLFALLLQNDGAIYFHCTAGKDRTGVAAFLIMLALGMREEDAIREYLLSNEYLNDFNTKVLKMIGVSEEIKEYCEPLLYVQKENIELMINEIKKKYKDYNQFLEEEYGIDENKRKYLRSIYCE